MDLPKVILKAKRADILTNYRHPWVFSKGLAHKPELEPGTQVRVVSQDGRQLGWAFYHPHNAISLRLIDFGPKPMDQQSWQQRMRRAWDLRKRLLAADCHAFRLIHGENDGFPGLTVDVYGDVLCLQITTFGMEKLKQTFIEPLLEVTGAKAIYERSDGHARRQEGLQPSSGFLAGECSFPLSIKEGSLSYLIDPASDHKTGFYLDQRPQRAWVQRHARNLRVLDLCCYSGGFTLSALAGGAAHVVSVDSSANALNALRTNLEANSLEAQRQTSTKADMFDFLKNSEEQPFDLVILDPPSMAKSHHAVNKARNGYRQLNKLAAARVKPGGLLMTFSCTGVVNEETFRKSVFLGLHDAHREALLLQKLGPGLDHPVHLDFPEGDYLKGLCLNII